MGGRTLDAGLHLLDRQLVDADGQLAGKVDDLELTPSEDGQALYVTAILSGGGALAARLARRQGSWLESIANRLFGRGDAEPVAISFGVVKRIGSSVELAAPKEELETDRPERWLRQHVIGRIPGAGHAPE
jgi:sporulation protein YlmC with PRC-barrel domain